MAFTEKEIKIAVGGGGSGPLPIENELLNVTPNVWGITPIHDSGGHSGDIRSLELGILPPGDATNRMGIRIRNNPELRKLFTFRWKLPDNNHLNGHRPSNDLLAGAQMIAGSHSEAIKLLENAFSAHYIGRIFPASDDDVHLRAILEDGSFIDGEHKIDKRTNCEPPIKDIVFIDNKGEICVPNPNPEAIEAISMADIFVIPPSSWRTSNQPQLRTIRSAIVNNKIPVVCFCNAVTNYSETHGFSASDFARGVYSELGVMIDYFFVNMPNHKIPETYDEEKSYPVTPDGENCCQFAKHVYGLPLTTIRQINEKPTIRHDGKITTSLIMAIAQNKNLESAFAEHNIIPVRW
ncbi:MAG: YvcK family protein [Candidatus Daviesbacteria bacterium]|nr:YvcK family protein [Candidatus Daviesbacteria bacterium]